MSARRLAGRQPRDTIAVRRPGGWAQVMPSDSEIWGEMGRDGERCPGGWAQVMPSDSETLGFVVLEAMASGVPAVAADAGGLRLAEI